jgi:hypothetical protein
MTNSHPSRYWMTLQPKMFYWEQFLSTLDTLTINFEMITEPKRMLILIDKHPIDRLVAWNIFQQAYADKGIQYL